MSFPFSKFQMTIVKNLIMDFLWSSTTSQIFLIYPFLTMKGRKCIWTEMQFAFLFFLNKSNITTSLLMIHLKCTVAHYVNLNSRFISKPFLNQGPLNILFRFFRFLTYVYFNGVFVKSFTKKILFFNTNFQNIFQDVVYYRILGCQTLWY